VAIVTVSRGSMSGGLGFAQCLAKRLHYSCLSRETIVQEAERLMLPNKCSAANLKAATSIWERMTMDRRLYFSAVQTALANAVIAGDAVYHGHSGHLLLKGVPAVLKVRLIAPMPMRIKAVMEQQELSYSAAHDYIHEVDEERTRWTKFIYGVDWKDPANYDLVINLADIGIDYACEMVATIAQHEIYRNSEAVKKSLHDFALACRVKLALLVCAMSKSINPKTINFSATSDDGRIKVLVELAGSGFPVKKTDPLETEIQRAAEGVEGVKHVEVEIRLFAESEA
jgi:cytidylate kinase